MRTSPATEERFVKVKLGEMDDMDAQRELSNLSFEDWFRFEQLMEKVPGLSQPSGLSRARWTGHLARRRPMMRFRWQCK
jgi:hypothetical protein